MRYALLLLAMGCWLPGLASAEEAKPRELKVVVPGVVAYSGIPAGTADVLSDLLLEALISRHGVRAFGPSDVRAMLSSEQQRQLLGCSEERCMADLAGALGADWLVAGSVGKLDDLFVINLQIIDAREARVTARVSDSLHSLKEAPEHLGPLVDKLLGSQPRIRAASPAFTAPPRQKPAMELAAYRQATRAYDRQLLQRPYTVKLVSMRRELLEDLVLTPFQGQFDSKASCFWSNVDKMKNDLEQQWEASADDAEANDAARCNLELEEFISELQLLQEAYPRGLEMEKNGTGRRLEALPFAVKEVVVAVPEETPEVKAYREAYRESQPLIAEALRLVAADDYEGFEKLYTPLKPGVSRTSPKIIFDMKRSTIKNGYRFEVCPFGIHAAGLIEQWATTFSKTGQFQGCARYMREKQVYVDSLMLVREAGKWRVDYW